MIPYPPYKKKEINSILFQKIHRIHELAKNKEVEEKTTSLKAVLDTGTKEDLEAKTKDLSDSLQKIGQVMAQNQPQEGQKTEEQKKPNGAKKNTSKEEPIEGEVVN